LVKTCDVRDASSVSAVVTETERKFGGVDGLVYSAGIQTHGTVEEMSHAEWERTLNVNLTGAYLACRSTIPAMRRRGGGAIAIVSSVLALAAVPRSAAYAVSKAGLLGLVRAMAIDHAVDGIRVNGICPGAVDTPMWRATQKLGSGNRPISDLIARAGANYPLGRIAEAVEVAATALYLLSPEASFVTGAEIVVDGGRLAAYTRSAPAPAG
jgi:NAD(P)-dependent dehydrogenase (short-subunit alcohol dehydrogenase family)